MANIVECEIHCEKTIDSKYYNLYIVDFCKILNIPIELQANINFNECSKPVISSSNPNKIEFTVKWLVEEKLVCFILDKLNVCSAIVYEDDYNDSRKYSYQKLKKKWEINIVESTY